MKRAIVGAMITLSCALPGRGAAQTIGAQVKDLLPIGDLQVEVLELWSPPRLAVLERKFLAAALADSLWFKAQLAATPPGRPLPYHPKLGLTESEYREFLDLTSRSQMRPTATGVLTIESIPNGWRIGDQSAIAALRGLQIDTVANVVHSSFGTLLSWRPVAPSDAQRIGRWGGPRWRLVVGDTSSITSTVANFAIGRVSETRQRILYFDGTRTENGQITASESVVLRAGP